MDDRRAEMSGDVFGVLGATGQQGGAVVRALRERGAEVRAFVRGADEPRARSLAGQGIDVVRADTDDPASLLPAFTGLTGLFAMTVFASHGPAGEVVQGRTVADAAAAVAVPRVVYSSVGGAERRSGVPHFDSKWAVEEYLRASAVPTKVVRPVFFMENFVSSLRPTTEGDTVILRAPLRHDVALQMIAVRDIGSVAAAALLDPDAVVGDAVEVAGDELTPDEVADLFGLRAGKPGRFEPLPLEAVTDDDSRAMFGWLSSPPAYQADFDQTRRLDPEVRSFDAFLDETLQPAGQS